MGKRFAEYKRKLTLDAIANFDKRQPSAEELKIYQK